MSNIVTSMTVWDLLCGVLTLVPLSNPPPPHTSTISFPMPIFFKKLKETGSRER